VLARVSANVRGGNDALSTKSLRDWLAEGELLYNQAMNDYRGLEAQLEQIEKALGAKRTEVNQIAQVVGKPPVEPTRRLSAQLIEAESVPTVVGTMTRALTGRGLGRA
jgi:hypothetical protein